MTGNAECETGDSENEGGVVERLVLRGTKMVTGSRV